MFAGKYCKVSLVLFLCIYSIAAAPGGNSMSTVPGASSTSASDKRERDQMNNGKVDHSSTDTAGAKKALESKLGGSGKAADTAHTPEKKKGGMFSNVGGTSGKGKAGTCTMCKTGHVDSKGKSIPKPPPQPGSKTKGK